MTVLSEEDLAFVALQGPSQAHRLALVDPPGNPIGEGRGAATVGFRADLLLAPLLSRLVPRTTDEAPRVLQEAVLRAPHLVTLPLHESLGADVATVRRWKVEVGVFTLSSRLAAVRLKGNNEPLQQGQEDGGGWVIDARRGPVLAHLASAEGEFLLRFEGGSVALWRLERPVEAALEGLRAFRPVASPWSSPDLTLPGLGELLADAVVEPWLREHHEQLHRSPSWLDRVASVGMLSRLHTPAPEELAGQIQSLLAGETSLLQQRTSSWARELSGEAVGALERAALGELDRLGDFLQDVVENDRWGDASTLTALLLRRDNLESVAWVLRLAGAGSTLREALLDLDRQAELHLTALQGLPLREPRLAAVAWQEPMAWWGVPAHGAIG